MLMSCVTNRLQTACIKFGSWSCTFRSSIGFTKTYYRILKHFFVRYLSGIRFHLLHWLQAFRACRFRSCRPFNRDKNRFLLTIMWSATRLPEAIPLRKKNDFCCCGKITFSTFGPPKMVQTDPGTNFLSKRFRQMLKT